MDIERKNIEEHVDVETGGRQDDYKESPHADILHPPLPKEPAPPPPGKKDTESDSNKKNTTRKPYRLGKDKYLVGSQWIVNGHLATVVTYSARRKRVIIVYNDTGRKRSVPVKELKSGKANERMIACKLARKTTDGRRDNV